MKTALTTLAIAGLAIATLSINTSDAQAGKFRRRLLYSPLGV